MDCLPPDLYLATMTKFTAHRVGSSYLEVYICPKEVISTVLHSIYETNKCHFCRKHSGMIKNEIQNQSKKDEGVSKFTVTH